MKGLPPFSVRHFFLCFTLVTALATCAHAAVTNVAWYRLGENDPSAASSLAVANTTIDLVGANHLKQFCSPLYTNAPAVPQRYYRLRWP